MNLAEPDTLLSLQFKKIYDMMSAGEKNVLAHSASDELDHESQIHDMMTMFQINTFKPADK